VNRAESLLLLGAGLPLVVAIVLTADRKGCFRRDEFPTPVRRRAALTLLVLVTVGTVLLPALATGRTVDTSRLRFPELFSVQAMLAAFLVGWWLLAGRPPLRDFLALRSARPLTEAGAGVCLGLIGWTLTLLIAVVVFLLHVPGPRGVSPLVGWIAVLPVSHRLLIIAAAMTFEELHFRAFLQRRIGALPASILFLLSHGGYGEPFFLLVLVGITAVLSLAFARTGSVIAPVVAHGTFDAIQLLVILPVALRALSPR